MRTKLALPLDARLIRDAKQSGKSASEEPRTPAVRSFCLEHCQVTNYLAISTAKYARGFR